MSDAWLGESLFARRARELFWEWRERQFRAAERTRRYAMLQAAMDERVARMSECYRYEHYDPQ